MTSVLTEKCEKFLRSMTLDVIWKYVSKIYFRNITYALPCTCRNTSGDALQNILNPKMHVKSAANCGMFIEQTNFSLPNRIEVISRGKIVRSHQLSLFFLMIASLSTHILLAAASGVMSKASKAKFCIGGWLPVYSIPSHCLYYFC